MSYIWLLLQTITAVKIYLLALYEIPKLCCVTRKWKQVAGWCFDNQSWALPSSHRHTERWHHQHTGKFPRHWFQFCIFPIQVFMCLMISQYKYRYRKSVWANRWHLMFVIQQSLERQRTAEKERIFLVYAKQWWREFLEIRTSNQSKMVKIFAQVWSYLHLKN